MKKELRVLLPPWSVAVLAAFLLPVVTTLAGRMSRRYFGGLPVEWIQTVAGISIFVGCLAMAAMSFGVEIQHRTFGLMLVQPLQRWRIWWAKILPLVGAFVSVGVALMAGQLLSDATWGSPVKTWDGGGFLVLVILLAGAMCSGAFWTLQSRSIIGGMVLPLAVQSLFAFAITYFASGRTMEVPEELEPKLSLALGVGAVVYCILFAYLGWWKFSRLEWREGIAGESIATALPVPCRVKASRSAVPGGPWESLLRKELRLHRPVFLLATLFVVCWLAALGLKALRPAWEGRFEDIFGVILAIYLPLAWLLSGCISLGEEKQLGTWGWHLTLPVSRVQQWAVKISVGLVIVLVLGVLMPALALLSAKGFKIDRPDRWMLDAWPALLLAVYGAILSFWAVTMLGTAVRAVLFTLLGAGVLLFGGIMMRGIGDETRIFSGFCGWLVVEFQLLPYSFASNRIIAVGSFVGLSLLLALLLRQSYVHCRREPSLRIIIKCSVILMISLFLPLWLSSDLTNSFRSPRIAALSEGLGAAVTQLPANIVDDAIGKWRAVSLEELDRTGAFNPETRRWLRGASIQIRQPVAANGVRSHAYVQVGVTFSNGRYFEIAEPRRD